MMPKKTDHPRLRTHIRKGEHGQVWTSWWYDMRPEGKPDVSLGTDYDLAIAKWRELHENKPRIVGTIMEAMLKWEAERLDSLETRYESEETRKGYRRQLGKIKPAFGSATWDQISMVELKAYLKKRKAKTQGNRELAVLSIIWHYAIGEGITKVPWPAYSMKRSPWKNKEKAREFEVTDELFNAVYGFGDRVLKDAMDLASATGMRLTDCRTILLPPPGGMKLEANKTGKKAVFDIGDSTVLPGIIERRRTAKATHLMLLSTPTGRPLSARMLRDRYDEARAAAKAAYPHLAEQLTPKIGMFLRDMRKRAADLSEDDAAASKLLQHDSVALTKRHYRSNKPTKLRPVR